MATVAASTTADGGPDESHRFKKTIEVVIHHFCESNFGPFHVATCDSE